MRFEQLHYLDVTLRVGSFRGAASELGITQPSLSAQIQRLEEDLGIVLLVRGTRGVRATDAALAALPHVRAALRAESALRQEASSITGLRSGRVRFGTISAASHGVLPSLVRRFQEDYPNINFQVTEGGSMRIRMEVLAGAYDFAIISRYNQEHLDDSRLRYIDVARGRVALAVHRDHPLAGRSSVRGIDLAGESFVAFHEGYLLRDALSLLTSGIDVHIVYYTDSSETAQHMVSAGVGLSLASTLAANTNARKDVKYVAIDEPWAETRMSVILRAGEQPSPAVRSFLQIMREANALPS